MEQQPEKEEVPFRTNLDVSSVVIEPSYRSTPWAAEALENGGKAGPARVMLVSESNACRSVLAEAMLQVMLERDGLSNLVVCESKGTRDYVVGEEPPPAVLEVAADLGLPLRSRFAARVFDPETDIVRADLVLVMDKFTAADVLREVSVYDTINPEGKYSRKVRFLGSFHPVLGKKKGPDACDIDDPLYGNVGGEEELAAIRGCARTLIASCEGFVALLQQLATSADEDSFRARLLSEVASMEATEWLVPPMLQPR